MDLRAPTVANVGDQPAEQSPLRPVPPASPRRAASAPGGVSGLPDHAEPGGSPGATEYASWLRLLRPTAS